jgi:hypothetical protein
MALCAEANAELAFTYSLYNTIITNDESLIVWHAGIEFLLSPPPSLSGLLVKTEWLFYGFFAPSFYRTLYP